MTKLQRGKRINSSQCLRMLREGEGCVYKDRAWGRFLWCWNSSESFFLFKSFLKYIFRAACVAYGSSQASG